MAIITILLSCAIGAIAGLIQLTFAGASFGQAFLTYAAVSVVLPVAVGLMALLMARFRLGAASQGDDLEIWQDWQTEEMMEADRRGLLATPATTPAVEVTKDLAGARRSA